MAFNSRDRIVTDGISFSMDSYNMKSYVSGDTTVYDLTSNGNDGALMNGVGFDDVNFVFDGINDFIEFSPSDKFAFGTNDLTINFWMYSSSSSQNFCIWDNQGSGGNSQITRIGGLFYFDYNGIGVTDWNYTVPTGEWVNICFSKIGADRILYANGELFSLKTGATSVVGSSVNTTTIGKRNDNFYPLNGKIGNFYIYKNKGLTAEEVKQNYNATKWRFQ